MQSINYLPFAQLRNAEHVAFFYNVQKTIERYGATDLGLTAESFTQYTAAVNAVQDIVLKTQGSKYTADIEAYDAERDRLFRLVRYKLQAIELASPDSSLAQYQTSIEKYILNKYSTDIIKLPYQEETAHLNGFMLDMKNLFTESDIETMGITTDLEVLKAANDTFTEVYLDRADERSGTTAEETKRLRQICEERYELIRLHIEYVANYEPESEKGALCNILLGVINELIRDARLHLEMHQGNIN